jgi:ceramide glucosyltransferase
MSVEMTSGVLVAEMLEGMRFALGPSMVVRKRCVDQIGGFQRLGDYYADDFMLGNLVYANGSAVVLSNHVVDHCVVNTRFTRSLAHQWDWMKSTRFSRPKGHFGTGLTFGAPFWLIALVAAVPLGKFWFGLAVFTWTFLARVAQSLFIGGFIVRDRDAVRLAFLYPLRDLLGFVLWAGSYMSRRVGWRDDRFELRSVTASFALTSTEPDFAVYGTFSHDFGVADRVHITLPPKRPSERLDHLVQSQVSSSPVPMPWWQTPL